MRLTNSSLIRKSQIKIIGVLKTDIMRGNKVEFSITQTK